jgi:hypothetical protein
MKVKFAKAFAKTCLLLTIFSSIISTGTRPVLAQNVEDYVDEFAELAGETAARFGNNVAVYEIWNEEDSTAYLSEETYARILEGAYSAIKANSSSRVIVGGLASGDTGYLTRVSDFQGGALKADGVGLHPYAQYNPVAMSSVLNNYLGVSQGKPLWITEFGWGTPNQGEQANYLEMAINTFNNFGSSVRVPTWYCWSDIMSAYLSETFGLIDFMGGQKDSYWRFHNVAQGAGVNIDPLHPYPHTPTANDLQNLGAGWVRIVYRPKVDYDFYGLISSYKAAGIETILILNQETLWTEDLPGEGVSLGCRPATSALMVASDPKTTPNAVKEKVESSCTGILCQISVALEELIGTLKGIFGRVINAFSYKNSEARGPTTINSIQQKLFRKESEERGYEGIVARMLPPGYRQDGYDVKYRLAKAECQMSEGVIITNPQGTNIERGYYDFGAGHYEDEVLFPDVPALFNKSAFIRQTFVPGAPKATVPLVDCENEKNPSGAIIFKGSSTRDVLWKGGPGRLEIKCEPEDPTDPDCNDTPDEEGEDGECVCTRFYTDTAVGSLQAKTKVALTSESWANVAGGSGMLDIFKPPGDFMFTRSDTEVEKLPFSYDADSGEGEDVEGNARASVKDLGGVEKAFRCVTDQLLMPPSTARKGACEPLIVEATYNTCTEAPECYGIPKSQPNCPDCSGDYDHEITPACTLGIEPDSGGAMLFCYGNSCRSCATSPAIPSPQGCCGSGYTVPGSGASCANPAGGWWIGGDQFPNGMVLYNGYTYNTSEMSGGAALLGVYVCDANTFACQNSICSGVGTPVPKEEGTSFQSDTPQPEEAQTQPTQLDRNSSIWDALGSFIGSLFRSILRL